MFLTLNILPDSPLPALYFTAPSLPSCKHKVLVFQPHTHLRTLSGGAAIADAQQYYSTGAISYSTLNDAGAIASGTATPSYYSLVDSTTNLLTGTSGTIGAAPEPTSGLLLLLGGARKRPSIVRGAFAALAVVALAAVFFVARHSQDSDDGGDVTVPSESPLQKPTSPRQKKTPATDIVKPVAAAPENPQDARQAVTGDWSMR